MRISTYDVGKPVDILGDPSADDATNPFGVDDDTSISWREYCEGMSSMKASMKEMLKELLMELSIWP